MDKRGRVVLHVVYPPPGCYSSGQVLGRYAGRLHSQEVAPAYGCHGSDYMGDISEHLHTPAVRLEGATGHAPWPVHDHPGLGLHCLLDYRRLLPASRRHHYLLRENIPG